MCTVQGCADVAAYFLMATTQLGVHARSGPAAYCEAHAEDAAKRMGHPWPVSESKPAQQVSRNTRSLVG
jgi:hypothetical protein